MELQCVICHSTFDYCWSLDDKLLSKDKFTSNAYVIIDTKKIQQNNDWEITEDKWLLFYHFVMSERNKIKYYFIEETRHFFIDI